MTSTSLTGRGDEAPTLGAAGVRSMTRDVDRWLRFRATQLRVTGFQAAVLFGDEILLSSAWGMADVERAVPMTTQHLFRIASHSKTFTATAVMQLLERGTLRLDDRVDQWLPELASPDPQLESASDVVSDATTFGALTLRDLLSHSGGVIRDGHDGDFWQLTMPFPDEAELLRIVADDSVVLPSNERFKYSNIGFSVLGLVIARAAGTSYHEFVTESIIDRLGLDDTGPEYDPARADQFAAGHTASIFGDRQRLDHCDTAAMASATGFYSTASDVCRYASAHFLGDRRLLSDASKRQMQRPAVDVGPGEGRYGLGFEIADVGGRRMLGHGGGYPGHITSTLFDPVEGLAVSVLTNSIDGPARELLLGALAIIELAKGGTADGPAVEPAVSDRFVGRFASIWSVVDVVAAGTGLVCLSPGLADPTINHVRFDVVDDDTLRVVGGGGYGSRGELWRYERAADGEVTSVRAGAVTMRPFELPA
ncbi:MAG: serine hydrolase domain-containing protein [Ilumatobacteraceae bacterium]